MTVTRKEKLELVAKVFYEDCKDDKGYPHKDWRGQYAEMLGSVTDDFIEFVYEMNRDRVFISEQFH